MKKVILALSLLVLVFSCKSKTIDIKSPCVSTEDGPCGPRKQVNEWWLKDKNNKINS